jgi:hypothetical protein
MRVLQVTSQGASLFVTAITQISLDLMDFLLSALSEQLMLTPRDSLARAYAFIEYTMYMY